VTAPPSGPLATRIWLAVPVLDVVTGDALDEGSEAGARAIDARAQQGHPCVLCGQPAGAALVVRPGPESPPFAPCWADLCLPHFAVLVSEGPGWGN
jgi:hypothetical protein